MTTHSPIIDGLFFNDVIDTVTVTLQNSFTVPQEATLVIPGTPAVTLNLGGQTLTNNGTIIIQSGGTLTGGTPAGPGTVIQE
jgi:hypothetical protein